MFDSLPPKLRRYSQILFANHALRSGATHVLNKPFYLFLEITNRCNIDCIHCGRTHDPRYREKGHVGDLPLHLIRKLKPIIPYASYVVPTGVGEPFLNRDLIAAIRFLKECGASVSVTSNGTILNERLCREVVESRLDKIIFSLDGARPETYNSIRAGADFSRVVRNIKNLADTRERLASKTPVIEVELIAMAENYFDLPLLPDVAADLGAECIQIETLFEHSGEVYGKILEKQSLTNVDLDTGRQVWEDFLAKTRRRGLKLVSPLLQRDLRTVFRSPGSNHGAAHAASVQSADYQAATVDQLVQIDGRERHFEKVFCTQPWSIVYVTWRGEVRTCCFNETVFGNLNENSIEEIWNGAVYKEFRNTILEERAPDGCHDCLQGGFNYDIVPKLEPAFVRRKLGEMTKGLIPEKTPLFTRQSDV